MRRGSLIFTGAFFLCSLVLLKATWAYSFKAKMFPMITLIIIMILLVVTLFQEGSTVLKTPETKESEKFGIPHVIVVAWMAGTVFMLWILGFMGTVLLLPFLYLRFQRESWLVSLAISLGCGLFFYGVFGFALRMPLYPGWLLSKIFA